MKIYLWFMLVLLSVGLRVALGWGEASSVSNIVQMLALAKEVAEDYGNGDNFWAPKYFFRLAVELVENSHHPDGVYSAPQSPPLACRAGAANMDLSKAPSSHRNFTMALPAEFPKSTHKMKVPSMPVEEIFERLFLRHGTMKTEDLAGLNFLWLTWVNFYFEDSLRTAPNTDGATKLDDSVEMSNLATVYGRNKERESLLRSFQNGMLRTSRNGDHDEEVALMWSDVNASINKPPEHLNYTFVLGDDGLNSHWGHIFWHTVYVLEHNHICRGLAKANPELEDERLFNMARVILTHKTARIFLENFASDIVLQGVHDVPIRIRAEVDFCASDEWADLRARPVRLHQEYLHAYTFHETIPDVLDYREFGQKFMVEDIFQNSQAFSFHNLQTHMDAFYRSAAGKIGPHNIPSFLQNVTIQQILHSRANDIPSYVDYYRYVGGEEIKSFDDLNHGEDVKRTLREIYETVDDIEFYTGTLSEDQFLNKQERGLDNPSVRTTMILSNVIPNFIAVSCYKDPHLYSAEFLTQVGLEMITEPNDAFVNLLGHHFHLEDHSLFSRFKTEQVVFKEPGLMGDLRFENLADFVGVNELWHHSLRKKNEFQYFLVAGVTAALIYITFMTIFSRLVKGYSKKLSLRTSDAPMSSGDVVLCCHYLVFAGTLFFQIPAYTVFIAFIYFSDRQDLSVEQYWFPTALMASLHFVLYIADIAVRPQVRWYLGLHHILWLLFFILPLALRDVFTLKIGLLMDYFVVYECGLYWLLFWAKANNRTFTPKSLFIGKIAIYVYAITRIIQLMLLSILLWKGFPRMRDYGSIAVYISVVILVVLVQISQIHVLRMFLSWPCFDQVFCFGHRKTRESKSDLSSVEGLKDSKINNAVSL